MDISRDDDKSKMTTGDVVMKQNGWVMTKPALGSFPDDGTKFIVSEEVKEIADQVIDKYRDDLRNHNICYVFKKKATKSDNCVILGQAKTESDLQKTLHGYDAVVLIGHDTWTELGPDEKFRLAMHELEHFEVNFETGKLSTRSHPVEEFPVVMKIFGPGQTSHVDFIHAYQEFQKNNGR